MACCGGRRYCTDGSRFYLPTLLLHLHISLDIIAFWADLYLRGYLRIHAPILFLRPFTMIEASFFTHPFLFVYLMTDRHTLDVRVPFLAPCCRPFWLCRVKPRHESHKTLPQRKHDSFAVIVYTCSTQLTRAPSKRHTVHTSGAFYLLWCKLLLSAPSPSPLCFDRCYRVWGLSSLGKDTYVRRADAHIHRAPLMRCCAKPHHADFCKNNNKTSRVRDSITVRNTCSILAFFCAPFGSR